MNLKAQINALNLLYKIVNGGEISELTPPKPKFKPAKNEGKFEELLPEQTGVRSEGLLKYIGKRGYPPSFNHSVERRQDYCQS